MSTSANLPAGFSITSINGIRCTAVPRSLTTLSGSAATAASSLEAAISSTSTSTSTSSSSSSSSSTTATTNAVISTQTQNTPDVASSSIASSTIVSAAVASSDPTQVTPTTAASTAPPADANTTTPVAQASAVVLPDTSTTGSSDLVTSAASTASKGTNPTTSSSIPIAVAQTEVRSSATATTDLNSDSGFSSLSMSIPPPTMTSAAPSSSKSATEGGIATTPRLTPGPVVGGVLGSIGFIAGVALLFWFLRKRRRDRRSLLTPLTTGTQSEFNENDGNSGRRRNFGETWRSDVGSQGDRLKAAASGLKTGILGIGASLKAKVVGDRSDTPGVNLNRGNSQFLDGPIPQHSRNNSVLSNGSGPHTVKERLNDWWERFRERIKFRKNNEPADPFAAARGMTEKQANLNKPPDFSQLLGMDDRELQLQAERRRTSFKTQSGSSLPPLGSLGLNFGDNPFADPITAATTTANPNQQNQAWRPPNRQSGRLRTNSDPFADPISQPQPSIPKQNTYVADIQRSRGQSVDATRKGPSMYGRPPSTNPATSRYPSTIAPSRDSYRDTVFSSLSANARKGKGRSDPFDLERPELWRNNGNGNVLSSNRASSRQRGASTGGRESANLYPTPLAMNLRTNDLPAPRVVSPAMPRVVSNNTYTSKYSSGIGSEWGDPGPDLGPGSGNSSLKGIASSGGGGANGDLGMWGRGKELASQGDGNVSPVSFEIKAGTGNGSGVGKAT